MATTSEKKAMVQYLNEYCFQSVWNSTRSEYRGNFKLTPVSSRLQMSSFTFDAAVVGLPTTETFMIYRFPTSLLQGSFELPDTQWYNFKGIANLYGVLLSVYDLPGHLIPMHRVWLLIPVNSDIAFVAVPKNSMTKCLSAGLSSDLYMTCYRNPRELSESITVYSQAISKSTDADTFKAQCNLHPKYCSYAVLNGVSYPSLSDLPSVKLNDELDIILDPTITGEYAITVDDTDNGYQSTYYAGHREILHCPKSVNPNNYLLTHDGATLFVRDPQTHLGVYFHRVDPLSVKQITHNDLSASRQTVLGFKDSLTAATVEVVVKVRAHASPRTLMSDSAWISDLYLLDDDTIVQMLRGNVDPSLSFWTAAALEQSGYIQLMFTDVDTLDVKKLDTYVSALGYYAVASILSSNVYTGTFVGSDLVVLKPFSQIGYETTALVYAQGKKISDTRITTTEYNNTQFGIAIANDQQYASGTPVVVRLLDGGSSEPTRFKPQANTATLTVTEDQINVYKEINEKTPLSGYNQTRSVSYALTLPGSGEYSIFGNTDGTYSLVFTELAYGNTYIIPPPRYTHKHTEDISSLVAGTDGSGNLLAPQPLVFTLSTTCLDGTVVPLLGYGNVEVYLNGFYLVRDVDYKLEPYYSPKTGALVFTDLVISNASYITSDTSGQTLEYYVTTDTNPSRDVGYCVDNVLRRSNLVSYWYPRVGTAFVEGVMTPSLLDCAVYMLSQTDIGNGSLYELKPTYSQMIAEYLSDYTPLKDEATIIAINTYMKRTSPALPSIVTLSVEHKIFSPFITAIVYDLSQGKISITDDPNDDTFVAQFDSYQYLKDRDPTLSAADTRVDRNYISVAASYRQFPTMTSLHMAMVQRLIKLTLITSSATLGETLV